VEKSSFSAACDKCGSGRVGAGPSAICHHAEANPRAGTVMEGRMRSGTEIQAMKGAMLTEGRTPDPEQ